MINRADNTRRRHARERLFIRLSFGCVCAALLFLVALLGDVAWQGWRSLISVSVRMEVFFDPQKVGADGQASALKYQSLYVAALDAHFDESLSRREKKELKRLASYGGGVQLRDLVRAEPSLVGQRTKIWLPLSAHAESYIKTPSWPSFRPSSGWSATGKLRGWIHCLAAAIFGGLLTPDFSPPPIRVMQNWPASAVRCAVLF